jgi:uncharacterized protein YbaR (Trm112 family)
MEDELPIYNRATNNIGDPPHAEAYCRCLAMEVERLARQDEREKIGKLLCEDCRDGVPVENGIHRIVDEDIRITVPCKAHVLEKLRPYGR